MMRKKPSEQKHRYDERKVRQLVLYVARQCATCRHPLTIARLNTLLYLADKEHLMRYGRTITHCRWIKREWGVELEGLDKVIISLVEDGTLSLIVARPYFTMA